MPNFTPEPLTEQLADKPTCSHRVAE